MSEALFGQFLPAVKQGYTLSVHRCVCVVVVHIKGDAGRQRDALLHPHPAR